MKLEVDGVEVRVHFEQREHEQGQPFRNRGEGLIKESTNINTIKS